MHGRSGYLYAFPRPGRCRPDGLPHAYEEPGLSIRQYFAARAPDAPQWYLGVCPGVRPAPEKPARLLELEVQVQQAYRADIQDVAQQAAREGLAVLSSGESRAGLLVRYHCEELDTLQAAHRTAHVAWEQETAVHLAATWPWYYADLVLGGEGPAPLDPQVPDARD